MTGPRVVSLVPSATETLLAWGVDVVACTRFCEQPGLRAVGGTKDPDLEAVVANRLDEISDEARRIGHVHESYSDEISVANILTRWRLGHILCVDDLDSWYEVERGGAERFYYQGGPRPVEDMPTVAEEIVRGVEAEDFEAVWMLEPSVHLP